MDKTEEIRQLFKGILELENIEECNSFFEDICTERELKGISQRLEVARLLKKHMTYDEIQEKIEVSTSTISRINKVLHNGNGGYQLILDRIDEKDRLKRV